jgi:flagellar basal-body rod protein FlgF
MNANGLLQTARGDTVQGDGGPITIPPEVTVAIGGDGTISTIATTTKPGAPTILGRIKLVNPNEADLVRGDDGLFRMREGLPPAEADAAVTVTSGAVEGSNVNPVEAMVSMIAQARSFEMQMKAMQTANDNAQSANKLLAYG